MFAPLYHARPYRSLAPNRDKKQNWETPFYKNYLSGFPNLKKELQSDDPQSAEAMDRVTSALVSKDAKLAESVAAAAVPVKHTIKVELLK